MSTTKPLKAVSEWALHWIAAIVAGICAAIVLWPDRDIAVSSLFSIWETVGPVSIGLAVLSLAVADCALEIALRRKPLPMVLNKVLEISVVGGTALGLLGTVIAFMGNARVLAGVTGVEEVVAAIQVLLGGLDRVFISTAWGIAVSTSASVLLLLAEGRWEEIGNQSTDHRDPERQDATRPMISASTARTPDIGSAVDSQETDSLTDPQELTPPWSTQAVGDQLIRLQNPSRSAPDEAEPQSPIGEDALVAALETHGLPGCTVLESQTIDAGQVFDCQYPAGVRLRHALSVGDEIASELGVRTIEIQPSESAVPRSFRILARRVTRIDVSIWNGVRAADPASSTLPVLIGRDDEGRARAIDLADAPHVLVAGATGSGKSRLMHGMLTSLCSWRSAKMVRLLVIDPKRAEMAPWNGVPQLAGPVVSDAAKALDALRAVGNQMEQRYDLMRRARVNTLTSYNDSTGPDEYVPRIVVAIEEYAELLAQQPDAEKAVLRLAQLGRAAGVHLILSTQRPSSDIVTGSIKANFPCRIALRLPSAIDSQTVLGPRPKGTAASDLSGRGDLLLQAPDGRCDRLQAYCVLDEDLAALGGSDQAEAPVWQ